jgi:TRAP-type C4-dicarboxylate transport system permease small subunit
MKGIDKWLERLLGVAAAGLLFAMMLLTFTDVILRYIFNAPLRGSLEVTELMMVVLIFAGLPLVSRKDEHVVMDLFDHMLTRRALHAVRRSVHVVCGVLMTGMGWLILKKAGKLLEYGDTSAVLRIELAPYVYVVAGLIFVAALIHVSMAISGGEKAD